MTHSEKVHRIRLAGPWECFPQGELTRSMASEKSPQRVKLPCSWQELFGEQSGMAVFVRRFNRPTGLTNHRLFLTGQALHATGEVLLNGELLGRISPDMESFHLTVPHLQLTGNRLEIRLSCHPNSLSPCGLWQPLCLEIAEI